MAFEPVNAIGPEFLSAFEARFDAVLADSTVSVVVLTSALRIFSAGADATWMGRVVSEHGAASLLDEFEPAMNRLRHVARRIRSSDLLFIAAINGHALAGGLELAAACDLRFAADEPKIRIGVSEMELFGVLPSGGGGTQFLRQIMGPGRALEFILDAKPCSPEKALAIGVIERLVPADQLVATAQEFGRRLAARAGRIGINAAKRAILDAASMPYEEAMALDHAVHWHAMHNGGFIPGVEDFVRRFG